MLLVLSPMMLGIALAVRLTDKGPALFAQVRVGKDARPFKIYKFRTVVVNAEARLAELRGKNEFDGVKIHKDPLWGGWLARQGGGCSSGQLFHNGE
jgi:lipopolysaccharide/colanic/teichoic acid biosynthesis glycosyltransferase